MSNMLFIKKEVSKKITNPTMGKIKKINSSAISIRFVYCYEFLVYSLSIEDIKTIIDDIKTRVCSYDSLQKNGEIIIDIKQNHFYIRTGSDFSAIIIMNHLRLRPSIIKVCVNN